MEQINQRKALRTRFMNELFEMAGGSRNQRVDTSDVAERLGLVFEYGKDMAEVFDIADYLKDEGLISIHGDQVYAVQLTHRGLREIEQAHSQPDEPTQHFAPMNIVYKISAHTITNSQFQQGSPGATQSLTVLSQDQQQQLEGIVQQLRTSIDDLGLGDEGKAELEADVQTLEAQVVSPKPKNEIVRPSLQSAKHILEGAASGVTAQGIIQAIGLWLGG